MSFPPRGKFRDVVNVVSREYEVRGQDELTGDFESRDQHEAIMVPAFVWIAGVLLAVIIALMFSFDFVFVSDDTAVLQTVTGRDINFLQEAAQMYRTWSSRVFILSLGYVLVQHTGLWRILTALALFISVLLPAVYLGTARTRTILLLVNSVLIATIPAALIFETGYVMTTVGYLFPYAAGLIGAYPAIAVLKGKPIKRILGAFAVLNLIFAVNSELVTVFLLALYTAALFVSLRRERRVAKPLIIVGLALSLFGVIFSITAPGNAARALAELRHIPGYEYFSAWQRFEIGFSSTLRTVFMNGFLAPLAFFTVVLGYLILKRANPYRIAIAALPLLGSLALSVQNGLFWAQKDQGPDVAFQSEVGRYSWRNWELIEGYPWAAGSPSSSWLPQRFVAAFTQQGLLDASRPFTFLVFGFLVACLVAALAALYWALGSGPKFYAVVAVIGMALASKAILGFSPSVWASGIRTDTFLLLGFSLGTLMIVTQVLKNCSASVQADGSRDPHQRLANSVGGRPVDSGKKITYTQNASIGEAKD
jgi:hypothetical protein